MMVRVWGKERLPNGLGARSSLARVGRWLAWRFMAYLPICIPLSISRLDHHFTSTLAATKRLAPSHHGQLPRTFKRSEATVSFEAKRQRFGPFLNSGPDPDLHRNEASKYWERRTTANPEKYIPRRYFTASNKQWGQKAWIERRASLNKIGMYIFPLLYCWTRLTSGVTRAFLVLYYWRAKRDFEKSNTQRIIYHLSGLENVFGLCLQAILLGRGWVRR